MTDIPKCDECGEAAYYSEQDIIEIEPMPASDGVLWAQWKPYGKKRFGCRNHRPKLSRTYRLDDIDYPKEGNE